MTKDQVHLITQAGNREKAAQTIIAHEYVIQFSSGHIYAVQCNMLDV